MPSPVPSRAGNASAASRVFANDAETAGATAGGSPNVLLADA